MTAGPVWLGAPAPAVIWGPDGLEGLDVPDGPDRPVGPVGPDGADAPVEVDVPDGLDEPDRPEGRDATDGLDGPSLLGGSDVIVAVALSFDVPGVIPIVSLSPISTAPLEMV